VLTAYVRGHAPYPPRLGRQPAADVPSDEIPRLRARAPDVQVALTVLGRGGFAADGMLDLTATDLRRADLKDADLRRANLFGGSLRGAMLDGADLRAAQLSDSDLREASLPGANLTGTFATTGTRWPDGFDTEAAGGSFAMAFPGPHLIAMAEPRPGIVAQKSA
jgi:hypothetical protein